MRKKTIAGILGVLLGLSMLSGCAETPESSLVKQKGKASLSNYEEGEALNGEETSVKETEEETQETEKETGNEKEKESVSMNAGTNQLMKMLSAPETYKTEIKDATGKLEVFTNATVEIPDAAQVSAISVSQHPFTQETMETITDIFCPDAKIYSSGSYYRMTKSDYQKKIEELKGYVAEGNLDPYNYGTDDAGNYVFDIYQEIEDTETYYQTAPEERELVEVRPQYGLTEEYDDGETVVMDNRFFGVACMPDGTNYDIKMKSYSSMPMDVSISKIYDEEEDRDLYAWSGYQLLKGLSAEVPEEEEMEELVGITLEEAKQIADEKVEKLKLPYIEMNCWEYGIRWGAGFEFARESMSDAGYIFHYTRKINGLPITYTPDFGGAAESMDSELETWGIEFLDITVTKDGIALVHFFNQYDIGEVKTENVKLMSFPQIMEIYKKMILVQNADVLNYTLGRVYRINRITFGYCRIYEPSSDSTTGILVPVWDFFGESADTYEGEDGQTETSVNASQYQSHLTINAIDGSIIDRGLGY